MLLLQTFIMKFFKSNFKYFVLLFRNQKITDTLYRGFRDYAHFRHRKTARNARRNGIMHPEVDVHARDFF